MKQFKVVVEKHPDTLQRICGCKNYILNKNISSQKGLEIYCCPVGYKYFIPDGTGSGPAGHIWKFKIDFWHFFFLENKAVGTKYL